jgi:hypothetical protein
MAAGVSRPPFSRRAVSRERPSSASAHPKGRAFLAVVLLKPDGAVGELIQSANSRGCRTLLPTMGKRRRHPSPRTVAEQVKTCRLTGPEGGQHRSRQAGGPGRAAPRPLNRAASRASRHPGWFL